MYLPWCYKVNHCLSLLGKPKLQAIHNRRKKVRLDLNFVMCSRTYIISMRMEVLYSKQNKSVWYQSNLNSIGILVSPSNSHRCEAKSHQAKNGRKWLLVRINSDRYNEDVTGVCYEKKLKGLCTLSEGLCTLSDSTTVTVVSLIFLTGSVQNKLPVTESLGVNRSSKAILPSTSFESGAVPRESDVVRVPDGFTLVSAAVVDCLTDTAVVPRDDSVTVKRVVTRCLPALPHPLFLFGEAFVPFRYCSVSPPLIYGKVPIQSSGTLLHRPLLLGEITALKRWDHWMVVNCRRCILVSYITF